MLTKKELFKKISFKLIDWQKLKKQFCTEILTYKNEKLSEVFFKT